MAGLVTGLIARLARSRWAVWLYPAMGLGISLGFSLLRTIGSANSG